MEVFKSGVPRELQGFVPMRKTPSPVWMRKMAEPFEVHTNEGILRGLTGDYVAFDPLTLHCWPVSAAYVALHYRSASTPAPEEK